jgi:RNA polymerase sigma-70 factor (ECF subfamily)
MESSYQEIIRECKGSIQGAQMAFYDLFAPTLFASAYRLLNNEWEAEEVVQEVLLRVLTNTSLLKDEPDEMQRFLKRIAINMSIDHLRQRRIEWEDWDDNLVTQTEESTETAMIRQEHMAQLHTAIAMMSERDRTVLLLSLVEELTTEEMSKVLGIKPSSVRSQLSRAKQRLIKLFQR